MEHIYVHFHGMLFFAMEIAFSSVSIYGEHGRYFEPTCSKQLILAAVYPLSTPHRHSDNKTSIWSIFKLSTVYSTADILYNVKDSL